MNSVPEPSRRRVLRGLALLGITGHAAAAIAAEADNPMRLREMVTQWPGLPDPLGVPAPLPPAAWKYLERMDAKFAKLTPRQIAAHVKELSVRDADWRRRKCVSLRAAEGIMGASAQALLNSSLATRVSEGFPGAKSLRRDSWH